MYKQSAEQYRHRPSSFKLFSIALLLVSLVTQMLLGVPTARAQESEKETPPEYSLNDIGWYDPYGDEGDPDGPCSSEGSGSGTSGDLAGNGNIEKIFNFFHTKGYTPAVIAGILGNIEVESGSSFNPFRMQDTYADSPGIDAVLPINDHGEYRKAFGIVQWDGSRRQNILRIIADKYSDYRNLINTYGTGSSDFMSAPDGMNDKFLQTELDYLWQELTGSYSDVHNELKSLGNTEADMERSASLWNEDFEVSSDSNQNRIDRSQKYYERFKDRQPSGQEGSSAGGSSGSSSCGGSLEGSGDGSTGGVPADGMVLYLQCDDRWGSDSYGGGAMCDAGCGPTSMAMIIATLVDKNVTPPDIAAVAGAQYDGTSSWENLVSGVSGKWGVRIESTTSFDDVYAFLESGQGMVWVGGSGDLPYTSFGHMIALTSVTSDGNIMVADPAGGKHPQYTSYTVDQIGKSHTFYKVYKK